jgi:hypothetical protein
MTNKKTYDPKVEQINGENITVPKGGAPVKKIENPNLKGDAELPVVNPGAGALPASTASVTPTAKPTTNDTAPATTGYTSNNETAWANGYESYAQYLNNMKGEISPNATSALTDAEYDALLKQMGITPEMVAGINKNAAAGTSQADETLLSDTGYALIQSLKAEYASLQKLAQQAEAAGRHEEAAQYRAQMKQVNETANRVRAGAGYYGGTDGSMYVTLGALGVENGTGNGAEMGMGAGAASGSAGNATGSAETELRDLLEQWKAAAEQQANGQIDYAVEQAIKELERALEDAQPQFKEQAESVALAERQAMDNAALYAELRGDKGGIGQEQYSSIQNTAAQNHLAVQQAQTKLSTDTARQIEDLRAQGEFEKADKALEITQNYLAQLIGLEQWAAEYNLSVEQFQASLQQWELEYSMAMQQLQDSKNRWEQEFGFEKDKYATSLEQSQKEQLANVGWAILELGGIPEQKYLEAMDMNAATAQMIIAQMKQKESSTQKQSAGYDDVATAAKKKGSADLTDKYLGSMVDSGIITLEEADWIFRVLCGYSYDQLISKATEVYPSVKEPIHYGNGNYTPVQMT